MVSGHDSKLWTQKSITEWAEGQFGYNGPLPIAVRGNKEMAELLSALQNWSGHKSAKIAAEECADVAIFLLQISERLGYDLLAEVQRKMDINEKRTWHQLEDGSHQHVD